ncbi:MAG: hypothetical protein M5T61_08605 [Acidimicrobiia bacterium]|nr:hypothetical protein [Acidimicrobiia bacterium]
MAGAPLHDQNLAGGWRACEGSGELVKEFAAVGFDDRDWIEAAVPGHWRSTPTLEASDGPVLYRCRFSSAPVAAGRRRFVILDGVFYYGDVWFDGTYLGATEGYFTPHAFEATEMLCVPGEHVLAVEVACPPQADKTAKRLVTGVFSQWDNLDPDWNPGGLWRSVHVIETGPVRIARRRVVCTEATAEHGRLVVDVTLDYSGDSGDSGDSGAGARTGAVTEVREPDRSVASERRARISISVLGPSGSLLVQSPKDVTLAAGANHLSIPVEVDSPPRWWPRRFGDQPICEVSVTVEVDGEVSDGFTTRTAFREVRLDQWTFYVNGERIFVMGSNHGPTRMALAEASSEELRRDVELAVEANLDMLRVHGHVTRPELYDAADEAGLLLWQDFPLQWGYARSVRKSALRQAREMVDLLGHHPSIVIWCAHNEPLAVDIQPGEPMSTGKMMKTGARVAASMFLPSWNKDVLDRSVARSIGKADPSRPVDRSSGLLPGPASGGTDAHLYYGWYWGSMGGLAGALRAFPRLARFVTEFGAQAVPTTADWMEPERWPDLDWDRLFERHALQTEYLDRYVPRAEHSTFESWRDATQAYQAALIQLQIEDLRRLKYSPTGGFAHFCFGDGHQAVTWSVLDHERVAKQGYYALRDACRPVLGMLDPRDGSVHVVSELRESLPSALVRVDVDGSERCFEGEIEADAVTYIGRVDVEVAHAASVTVSHPSLSPIRNTYAPTLLGEGRR